MTRIGPARGPNDWPEAQRQFTRSVLDGATPPSVDVWVRWWTKEPGRIPRFFPGNVMGALVAALLGLVTLGRWAREGPQGTWVAIWLPSSRIGSVADLVVKVDPDDLGASKGQGVASLLGEPAPNGALCLIVGDRFLAPIFNPVSPTGLLAKAAGTRP